MKTPLLVLVLLIAFCPNLNAVQDNGKESESVQNDATKPAEKSGTQGSTESAPQKGSEGGDEFIDLMNQWKELEGKFKAKEAEFIGASPTRKTVIREEYDALLTEVETLVPKLRTAAVASYEKAPGQDESVVRFLIGALTNDLAKQDWQSFFDLGDILIAGGIDVKHLKAIHNSKRLVTFGIPDAIDELISRHADAKKNDNPQAVIKTSYGDIVLELYEDAAPNHVANFIHLAEEKKYYENSEFHRVEPELYLIQGGQAGEGVEPIDYTIAQEFEKPKRRLHFNGALGAATKPGDINSASSEFYIVTDRQPGFNGRYTVFGRVLSGLEFAKQVKLGDKILSVTITRKRDHEYVPQKYDPAAKPKESGDDSSFVPKGAPSKEADKTGESK